MLKINIIAAVLVVFALHEYVNAFRANLAPHRYGAVQMGFIYCKSVANDENSFEETRKGIVDLVEQTWEKVNLLVKEETMALCEQNLRIATTMLVLAIVRKSAGDSLESRATVIHIQTPPLFSLISPSL